MLIDQLKKTQRRKATTDLAIIITLSCLSFALFALYDVFEWLHAHLQFWERYELDEILSASLIFALLTTFFAWRRWQDVKQLQRYCEELSLIDPATQLPNRRTLERIIQSPESQGEIPIGLILVNLGGLEQLQTQYGVQIAEQSRLSFLYQCSHLLSDDQLLCVFGFHQLLIYCPHTDATQAQALAENLEKASTQRSANLTLQCHCAWVCLQRKQDFIGALEMLEDKLYQKVATTP